MKSYFSLILVSVILFIQNIYDNNYRKFYKSIIDLKEHLMKKFIVILKKRILSSNNSYDLAKASAIGIFLGMQPVSGIRILIAFLLSFLFELNIFSVFLGIMITIMFPFINVFPLWIGNELGFGVRHFYFFNPEMLSIHNLLTWSTRERYIFILNLFGGFLCALVSLPLFKLFYNSTVGEKHYTHAVDFVFYDSTGKKRSNLVKILISLGIFFFIICFAFGLSINLNPYLHKLGLKENKTLSHISYYSVSNHKKLSTKMLQKLGFDEKTYQIDYDKHNTSASISHSQKKVFGFYVDWDENSLISLKQNIKSMNVVVPDWYSIDTDLNIKNICSSSVDSLIKVNGVYNMPLINNYVNNNWDPDTLSKLINSPDLTNTFITNLIQDLKKHHYYGINIDFESLKALIRMHIILLLHSFQPI